MFKPKIAIAGASTGFILSLFVGVVSGNPLLTVLFRALMMAILSGGLAAVLSVVVVKFLPELGDNPLAGTESADSAGMVDITVGDSGGDINPFVREESDDQSTEDQIPDFLLSGRFDAAATVPGTQSAGYAHEESRSASDEVKPRAAHAPLSERHSSGRTSGGLDILPDLDDFVPARKDNEGNDDESFSSPSLLDDSSLGQAVTGGNESETMVKAIRTILARDA